MYLHPTRRSLRTPLAALFALVLTLGFVLGAAPDARAAWLSTGNAAADSSSRDEHPHTIAPDGAGGMYASFAYSNTTLDSLAIQHLNGDGAKAWGSQGVRVNPGGNGATAALLSPDSSGGVWALWADSRAGALGNYVQRFNAAGAPQLTFGGLRVFTRTVQNLQCVTTSAGELLVLFTTAGDSVFVQRIASNGTKEFSGDGVLLGIDADPFFATPNLIADGEGGIVTYPRSPGAATTQMWATRFNAAGTLQWGVNGTQVVAVGGITVLRQRADWDGTSLFCSWEHGSTPTGFFDAYPIRAQKLNGSGVAQWTANGVVVHTPVTGSPFFETFVPLENNLVADDLGGCYVSWFDPRNYNQPAPNTFLHGDDIYGQRLSSTGAAQWTANGAPIDSTAGGLDDMRVCTDAANGMLMIYTDFLFGDGDEDVEMRRVNGASAPATTWTKLLNSTVMSEDPSRERHAVMIPDGAGGGFAAWEDNRDETSSLADVYATRRQGSNGNPFVPTIAVVFPNGGEAFTSLRPLDITWSSTLGGNVKIELSNGSFSRTTIVASTPDDGAFTWLPNTSGSALKIFVSDATDGSPIDSSNATFTMCAALLAEQPYGNNTAANDLIEGDLNEDGLLDIVTATTAGDYVQFGQGTAGVGDGSWGTPVLVATPSSANDVIAEDFNDDGILDLATTTSSNGVQINLGNGAGGVGNGTYAAGTLFATGTPGRGLVSLDANEDGIRDLAVVNGGTTVSILLGLGAGGAGTGGFAAAVNYTVGTTPSRVVPGDFNEDGIADLAVTANGTNQVSILLGQGAAGAGNGTFAAAVNYATGTGPLGLCSGDFNEDGITDLAVAHNSAAAGVGILIGNGAAGVGNGTFAAIVSYPVGATVRDVAVIDLDGDGIADLAATHQTNDRVYALFGLGAAGVGNGTFVAGAFEYGGDGPSQMLVGDFLEDGAPDVVTGGIGNGNLTILEGYCPTALATTLTLTAPNGGQFFQTGASTNITWTKGAAVLAVDIELSRDGGTNWEMIATDVTGTSYPWTVTPQATTTARIRVRDSQLQNRVDGSNANFSIFTTPVLGLNAPDGGQTLPSISMQSILWAGNSGGNIRIDLTSNGGATRTNIISSTPNDGAFTWAVQNNPVGAGFRIRISLVSDPAVVDSSATTFSICPRYTSTDTLPAGTATVALASADFNEDGIDDLAGATGNTSVLISLGGGTAGVGDGSFVTHSSFTAGPNVAALAVGDLNRDGRLDLVAATDNGAAVLLGDGTGDVGNGSFGAATTFATGGDCSDVELADLNEDGILDIVAANVSAASIAVLLGQGANGVGTGSFAPAVAYGVRTSPAFLQLNDFNHDGILDMAVSCTGNNVISVRLGQGAGGVGDGTFGALSNITTDPGPIDLLTGDFNEGGTVDLVVLTSTSIQAFEGNGSGGFTLVATNTLLPGNVGEMAVCDFDGNAFPDLLVTNTSFGTLNVYPNDSGPDWNGLASALTLATPNSLALGDFLEDGVLDVALSCGTSVNTLTGGVCGLTFNGNLTSTLPAGGESFVPGTNHTISWTQGISVHAVNVELSRDAGRNWETIARNVIGSSIDWTVTRPVTDSALVRVRDSQIASRNDVTNSVFAIKDVLLDAPESLPVSASFSRPYPNPVREVVRFEMALPRAADVTVEAYDISGRLVHTLARGTFAAGRHPLRWGGEGSRRIAAGVYFVRAHWEGFESVQRVVRLE